MNKLSQHLVDQIMMEESINPITKTVVVYSGRFQPFHSGHNDTYQHLVKKFGKDNVVIGTSNTTDKAKSPFNFKEKKKIITTMFGVPTNKVVQIKNPYKPVEILSNFDETTTAFITVVGEKDSSRLGGKYFKKYDGNPDIGYGDTGYVYIAPKTTELSGTAVRNGLSNGTDGEKKEFFSKTVYPKYNKSLFDLITQKLSEGIEITKETIEDWMINEATKGGTG